MIPRMRTIKNQIPEVERVVNEQILYNLAQFLGFWNQSPFVIESDILKFMLSNHDRKLCLTPDGLLPIIFSVRSERFSLKTMIFRVIVMH
jgi:hypothetical protein